MRIWDTVTGEEQGRYIFTTETHVERGWLNPALDRVVLTGSWTMIGTEWNGPSGAEETTLWALPTAEQQAPLENQAPRLVQRVGFKRYGEEVRLIEPSVPVGVISSVTFTDGGHVLGTRFAFERGLLGQVTNGFITAGKTEVLAVWAIDDSWRSVGSIPGCGDGVVSPDGQFVAVATEHFGGIELWPLPPPPPPTRLAASLGAIAGLSATMSFWWLSRRRRGEGKTAPS
jgi:hypothetical protein